MLSDIFFVSDGVLCLVSSLMILHALIGAVFHVIFNSWEYRIWVRIRALFALCFFWLPYMLATLLIEK